jgi:exodeoxyribonuclease VIII
MDLMIDIETLSTGPDAMIMTIAAQAFDPISTGWPERHFYARVSPESQPRRHIDDSTVEWWAKQGPEAQREVFEEQFRRDLSDCLEELGKMIWQSDKIWANGPMF